MAIVDTLALTDDEAAAIAIHANGGWRTPLPTVDETDDADVASAIMRGRRSLVVRELARPDGTAMAEAAEVLAKLGTGPCAAFMLVDAASNWVPTGLTLYLYGPAPEHAAMSHVVAAAGVHYFRILPPPNQWLALTELAEAVYEDGFTAAGDGAQQPAAALLSVLGEAGLRSVQVAHRVVTAVRGPVSIAFTSVAQAVNWLLSPGPG
jgi:hypothetical protein